MTPTKAEPEYVLPTCKTCHEEVKQVPGGHGQVWVHADTGTVFCKVTPAPDPFDGILHVNYRVPVVCVVDVKNRTVERTVIIMEEMKMDTTYTVTLPGYLPLPHELKSWRATAKHTAENVDWPGSMEWGF